MTKQLIPKRRFKEFYGKWEKYQLSEVAEVISGGTPSTTNSNYWDGQIDWYTPTEIGSNIYMTGSQRKITALGLKNSSAKLLPPFRTILFTSRAGIGNMAILAKEGSTNQGFQSFVLKDNMDTYFLYSMGHQIKEYALRNASGSTFLEVSRPTLERTPLHIPQFAEQQKIGEFFKVLDARIANQERKIEKIKAIKQAYLTEMFPQEGEDIPKRRFKGFEDEWKPYKLGELGEAKSGVGFPELEQHGKTGIPFYKVSDMNREENITEMQIATNYVTEKQIRKRKWQVILQTPAIIFAKVGAAIYKERKRLINHNFLIDNNMMAYILSEKLHPYFTKTLFDTIRFSEYGQSGALPSFNSKDIERIDILLPKQLEQQKIGEFFKTLDEKIEAEEKKLEKLKKMKEAFLEEMFV